MTSPEPKPRDLGNIISETVKVYRANFSPLIGITAIVEAILFGITGVVGLWMGVADWTQLEAGDIAGAGRLLARLGIGLAILAFFSVVLGLLRQGALIHAVTEQYVKRPIDILKAYTFVWGRIGALLGANLLALAALIGMAITIIGIPFAIYFGIRWAFITQAVILEGKGPRAALSRSSYLVKGTWWRVLGIFIVIVLILVAIGSILTFTIGLIPWVGSSLVTILVTPLFIAAMTILYYDLVFRKEGRRLETGAPYHPPLAKRD